MSTITQLLERLDAVKTRFGSPELSSYERLLAQLSRSQIDQPAELLRYHELLLFISAYPARATIRKSAERSLSNFAARINTLHALDEDLSMLEHPEASGIAGMSVTDTFTYYIVRWLLNRASGRTALDWDWFEDENRLGETWPRLMVLFEEEAYVEANIPFQTWLRAASGGASRDLRWLIQQFQQLQLSDKEKSELYNSLQLYVTWSPAYRQTRTGMRWPAGKIFYHGEPLIQRREISLSRELANPPAALEKLSPKQGEALLDLTRAASTVRYRELYGFTHGDSHKVFRASIGRGVEIFIAGLPPGVRLPLRAYHAAMIFKNGVPVGYFEGLSIFERMESGFNLYYTFRDGETAWLYARLLSIFRHLLGVTAFSIDPYQIGFENEEGIESGAFWFYRKLGFRPTRPELMKLVLNEEKKIATRKNYRTSAKTLRKLAAGPMIFELDETRRGDWDRFEIRNIGLAAQRRMANSHRGNAQMFRIAASEELRRALRLTRNHLDRDGAALVDFAVALSSENVANWTAAEKSALAKVINAKAALDQSRYLKLMQRHERLRNTMIKLGSR